MLALYERGEDAKGGEDTGGDVGDRRAALDRRSVRALAGDAQQPAHALGDEVEAAPIGIGAGAPEAGNLAIDQPRVGLLQPVVAEAEALHGAAAVVLDHHVGGLEKPAHHLLAALGLQIDGDAALVAVHHHEGRRFALDIDGGEAAGIVATGDSLDLDHLGAEIGQQHARGRPGHDVGELDDGDAPERSVGVRRHLSAP